MMNIFESIADRIMSGYYYSSQYDPGISLIDLCESIKEYEYAFVKIDVPYMPDNFPYKIPIGKDADIICTRKSFELINIVCKKWTKVLPQKYNIIEIQEINGVRYRICGLRNVLIYQIDISWCASGLNEEFYQDAVRHRVNSEMYYRLATEYEYIYRMYAYYQNNNKVHHREYLISNQSDYNPNLAKRYLGLSLEEILGSMCQK